MAALTAERDLLFGLLALQNGLLAAFPFLGPVLEEGHGPEKC